MYRFIDHTSLAESLSRCIHFVVWLLLFSTVFFGTNVPTLTRILADDGSLWSLRPIVRPDVPGDVGDWSNPIDAFIAKEHQQQGVKPFPRAAKLNLLRRVSLDLVGLPPSVEDQRNFLKTDSYSAYVTMVRRMLDSPQHGVRYARHWLDVMRYADVDTEDRDPMPAQGLIYLWRDWVITALNEDLPYDEFVRAQITGYRTSERTSLTVVGNRERNSPRPDDVFALGFLARGATSPADEDEALAINAVETVSSAFMGLTLGCAKCHDHFYDPVAQRDFYAMKALFDPLKLKPVQLATVKEVFDHGQQLTIFQRSTEQLDREVKALTNVYYTRLYNERVELLPPDIQAIILKPTDQRTAHEQKTADEYYPVLRINAQKLRAAMPEAVAIQYDRLQKKINELPKPAKLPVFWTVAEDLLRRQQPRYILTNGDARRPDKKQPVEPGFPFADPQSIEFREGFRENFVDWLTDTENPLFARVAVNRIWQWHFGQGLHRHSSDFGQLGDTPIHPELLDWLSTEFIANGYRMKWLHYTIVTSEAYMRASAAMAKDELTENIQIDPSNRLFWRFPLQRLAAEPIWDSIHSAADDLDLSVGGGSFSPADNDIFHNSKKRRGTYLSRGFHSKSEVTPEFLRVFDVEDGRVPCSRRQQSVTAPQSLLLLNSPLLMRAAAKLADRVRQEVNSDLSAAVSLLYQLTLCRTPTKTEASAALSYLNDRPERLPGLCSLMFNLDEFIYVP